MIENTGDSIIQKSKHGPTDHRNTTEPTSTEYDPVPVTPEDFSSTQTVPGDRLQSELHSLARQDRGDVPDDEARGHSGGMQETCPSSLP